MSPHLSKYQAVLVLAAAACSAAGPAAAFDNDTLKLILAETLTHDSNLFKTSGATAPVADTTTSTSLKLALDTHLSRQSVQLSLSQSDNRYQRLSYLNNTGSNYVFGWQGEMAYRWTSAGSWSRSQSMANFADLRSFTGRDIVTAEAASLRLGYSPHADWPVYVQLTNSSSVNSLGTLAFNDTRTNTTEVGLTHNSTLGNQVGMLVRKTDGRYPNRANLLGNTLGDSYRQEDLLATLLWKPGIKSSLGLQLGRTRREQPPLADFSGPTGRLSFDWAPTVLTSINATMGREITPITVFDVTVPNYALIESYGLGVHWAPTAKISADAKISYQSRLIGGARTDSTTTSSLALQYAPIRPLQMSLQLRREVRASDNPAIALPYASNVGMLSATLSF